MTPPHPVAFGGAVLRRATALDAPAIAALIGAVFPDDPKQDVDVLAWQYWDNPYGAASSWLWELAGEPVAHFTAFPVPGVIGGVATTFAKTADAATLPEQRGLGLFAESVRVAVRDCASRGIPLVMCSPTNPASLRGLENAGMSAVGRVPVWVRPIRDDWLGRRLHVPRVVAASARAAGFRARRGARHHVGERVAAPPAGLDALWAATAPAHGFGVVHDAAWWRWRYVDRPRGDYRFFEVRGREGLRAAVATSIRDIMGARFVCVLDLLGVDAAAGAAAILGAVDDAAASGEVDGAAAMTLPATPIAAAAAAAGLRRLPRRLEPRTQTFGLLGADAASAAHAPWRFSWCDLDHV